MDTSPIRCFVSNKLSRTGWLAHTVTVFVWALNNSYFISTQFIFEAHSVFAHTNPNERCKTQFFEFNKFPFVNVCVCVKMKTHQSFAVRECFCVNVWSFCSLFRGWYVLIVGQYNRVCAMIKYICTQHSHSFAIYIRLEKRRR